MSRPRLASSLRAGLLSAALYGSLVGLPPTDPTTALSTAGAATFVEGTITVTSTLGGIALSVDYCYCAEHAAAEGAVGIILVECGGFGQAKSQFSQAHKRRLASYVGQTGRFAIVVAPNTRGLGAVPGTKDYNLDAYDRLDASAAVAAVAEGLGVTVLGHGQSFAVVGYSTGATDVQSTMAHLTDHVLLGVDNFGNWTLQEYFQLSAGSRASLIASVGDLGTSTAAQVDPYLARAGEFAIADLIAMPGGPHFFNIGDRDEAPTVPIPDPDRLTPLAAATTEAAAKVHVHISQSGDAIRYLHNDGVDGTGVVYAERFWMRHLLDVATEWNMPVAGKARVTGWMKWRGRTGATDPRDNRYSGEVWSDASAANCKASANAGKLHAFQMAWDSSGRFAFTPLCSTNGKIQVLSRWNDRRESFTAGTPFVVDLRVAPVITADTAGVQLLDPAHLYSTADAGTITGTTTVTAWADQPRSGVTARNLGASGGNEPATVTDGDGALAIEFTAANSDRMTVAAAIANMQADFVICGVVAKTNNVDMPQHAFAMSTTVSGKSCRLSFGYNSAVDTADFFNDSAREILNDNGLGAHAFTASNAKHFFVLMRKTELDGITYLYESLDGSSWSRSAVKKGVFTLTAAITVIGAGYAPGPGATYLWWGGRYYLLGAWDRAMSWEELEALRGNAEAQFTF